MNRVLVVDDDHDILDVIKILLEWENYLVTCCDNGISLLQVVLNFKPNLIIMDIMLSGLDGRELCRALKASPYTSHIPIILISASHDLLSANENYCKPDDYLAKPFESDVLTGKVNHFLRRQEQVN